MALSTALRGVGVLPPAGRRLVVPTSSANQPLPFTPPTPVSAGIASCPRRLQDRPSKTNTDNIVDSVNPIRSDPSPDPSSPFFPDVPSVATRSTLSSLTPPSQLLIRTFPKFMVAVFDSSFSYSYISIPRTASRRSILSPTTKRTFISSSHITASANMSQQITEQTAQGPQLLREPMWNKS